MKIRLAIAAAMFLAACGQPATTAPQTPAAPSASAQGKPDAAPPPAETAGKPDAATPAAASTPAPVNGLTPAMLVGRWGDNGDCTKDIVINADGTFHSYTGGGGNWSLNGNVMSMTGSNGTFQVRVAVVNGRTLMITNPDGSVGTSQRC